MIRFIFLLVCTVLLYADDAQIVVVSPVEVGEIATNESFAGVVVFKTVSKLASQTSALAKEVLVEIGDFVRRGDAIVILDSRALEQEILAKEAEMQTKEIEYKQAENDYERYKTLHKEQSISDQQLESYKLKQSYALSAYTKAKAELAILKIELENHTIRAPFDGQIAQKFVNPFEWVATSSAVVTIAKSDLLEFVAHLPISKLALIKPNMPVKIEVNGKLIEAKIAGISPVGDQATKTATIRADFATDLKLYEGQEATLFVASKVAQNELIVDRDAVINRFGKTVVFVVENKKAKMISVEIIGFAGNKAAVKSRGLKAGMSAVIKGNERIFPDDLVIIK